MESFTYLTHDLTYVIPKRVKSTISENAQTNAQLTLHRSHFVELTY